MAETPATPSPPDTRHRLYEDVLAVLLGTLMVAFGVTLYGEARLFTSGTAGLSLLVQFATGAPFGLVFFVVNLPFYYLAWRHMGWRMTLRTFAAVLLVSLFARLTPAWVGFAWLDPLFAAVLGGTLTGTGLLMLFRHRTGLGGINLLALYLQEWQVMRAGYVQFGVDAMLLLAACFVLEARQVVLSLVGAAVVNMILAINHRPGRYSGMS